jgi:L-histidine Nalpha-methyltransferase
VEAHVGAAQLPVALEAGETIWTESSHKYYADEIPAIAADAGFSCAHQWIEKEWGFAESLLAVK